MKEEAEIATQTPFRVGEWYVDPDSGHLRCEEADVKLEPKVMEVLVCLAQHQGKVVSRETLEAAAWAGMVVGYDAVSGSIIKLRKALGDNSRNPRYIETVSKRGYRLISDVEQGVVVGLKTQSHRMVINAVLLIAAGTILTTVISIWLLSAPGPDALSMTNNKTDNSEKSAAVNPDVTMPSIVVLPFKNLSDDPQQEYFSDGITDDLITGLSRVASLRVIARQSAYHFKNRDMDPADIARELGVFYAVEGSVQKSGKQVRINVQITDIETGQNIWAERFDGETTDIFDIQDRIARQAADAMFITLSNEERQNIIIKTTSNFEAYDTFLLGQQHSRNRSKEGFELSRDAYRHAIELDANYARAYGALAVSLTHAYRNQWTDLSIEEARERAIALANKAVLLNNASPQVYWSLGYVYLFRKEFIKAEAAALQTVMLSPNYADGYGLLAFIANWRGKAEEAERYIKKAIILNPYHTFDYPWNLGLAYYTLGRYEESTEALQNALERNETAMLPRLFLAADYVGLGRQDDAEWEIEQVIIDRPATTITLLSHTLPFEKQELMNSFLEDLKKAGLPE